MKRTLKSIPTAGMSRWWECGWAYLMPDFDNKDHSIIEWLGDQIPFEPVSNRVSKTQEETAEG